MCSSDLQPIRLLHPDGAIEEKAYHLDGTLALSIDSLGIPTHFRYDALGHLIETRTEGVVETYTYEGDLLVKKVDREGLITTYTYDGAGRKILETADGERTQFTYDAMGNLASQIEGDLVTSFTYDLLGRMLEETQKDFQGHLLKVTKYAYDEAGKGPPKN